MPAPDSDLRAVEFGIQSSAARLARFIDPAVPRRADRTFALASRCHEEIHTLETNQAVTLLRDMFGLDRGQEGQDVFPQAGGDPGRYFSIDVVHSLFGPSGTKQLLVGRDAFLAFARDCAEALSSRSDRILRMVPIDQNCAFVHARAFRRSAVNGTEITYEWAMLYRVEDGLITYGVDMLDADAQAFWEAVRNPP